MSNAQRWQLTKARTWIAIAMAITATMPGALPASAGPGDAPSNSGAVTRFTEPGLQVLLDQSATLDGEPATLVAIFNLETPEHFCTFQLGGAGELQIVETPSGRRNITLHDDVSVLVYDVTGAPVGHDFFFWFMGAACDPEDPLEPLATGEARIRNNVHIDDDAGTFQQIFKATGLVWDDATDWNLSAQRRVTGEMGSPPPPDQLGDRIHLARRGG